MLIRFSVENFKSFHGKQTFSMEADEGVTNLPGNTVETPAGLLVKTAAVYGHNASGKTNLIAAMEALRALVVNSQKDELTESLPKMLPFALHPESRSGVCKFEIEVLVAGEHLQYTLEASSGEITSETMRARGEGPHPDRLPCWLPVFARGNGALTLFVATDEFDETDRRFLHSRAVNERRCFIGFAASFDATRCRRLVKWFQQWDISRRFDGMSAVEMMKQHDAVADRWASSSAFRSTLRSLLADADLGVSGLLVTEPDAELRETREIGQALADGTRSLAQADSEPSIESLMRLMRFRADERIRLVHRSVDDDEGTPLPWTVESSGTRRFFSLLSSFLMVQDGDARTFVIDEIESSLSSDLVDRLIRLFHDPEVNRSASQLIFTTHDRSLMDAKRLLRRDQVWITQKGDDGATELYSLADFDEGEAPERSIPSRRFATGRYGGVAEFGRSLEALLPAEKPQKLPEVKRGEE